MQRDFVVVILYDSIYSQYKIANMINYQYWEQYRLHLYIVVGGCMVACRQRKAVKT
jgi:hypothetical protein